MKIAVNTRFLLPGKLEGIGWFSFEILQRLVRAHPEHDFYFLFDRKYDPAFVFAPNVIPVVLFPPARHAVLWYAWFEYAIPHALRRIDADVFVSTDGYCSLCSPVPTLLFWHDVSFLYEPGHIGFSTRWYYRHFVPKFLNRADRIITFSQSAREDLLRLFRISPEKVTASYGAARSVFKPISAGKIRQIREKYTKGAPYYLYVGAIHPRKNVHRLLRAFDVFREKNGADFKLLLAGRFAWKTGEVSRVYKQMKYRHEVVFLGHLDEITLPDIVAAAHGLVYPSLYEGFGLPVIEAIQCGVPVITSNIASLPEVAGDAGLLVAPRSEFELTEAMCRLVQEEDLYRSLAARCPAQAARFSWDKTASDVYDALVTTARI